MCCFKSVVFYQTRREVSEDQKPNTSQWASAAIKTALKEVNIEQKKKDRPGDDGRDAPKCVSQTCVACIDTVTALNFEKMQ